MTPANGPYYGWYEQDRQKRIAQRGDFTFHGATMSGTGDDGEDDGNGYFKYEGELVGDVWILKKQCRLGAPVRYELRFDPATGGLSGTWTEKRSSGPTEWLPGKRPFLSTTAGVRVFKEDDGGVEIVDFAVVTVGTASGTKREDFGLKPGESMTEEQKERATHYVLVNPRGVRKYLQRETVRIRPFIDKDEAQRVLDVLRAPDPPTEAELIRDGILPPQTGKKAKFFAPLRALDVARVLRWVVTLDAKPSEGQGTVASLINFATCELEVLGISQNDATAEVLDRYPILAKWEKINHRKPKPAPLPG